MTKTQLHILATVVKSERSKVGESSDYVRGIETVAKEIAWQMQKDLRLSAFKAMQKADDFLIDCGMI